jgi:hypothetical protein
MQTIFAQPAVAVAVAGSDVYATVGVADGQTHTSFSGSLWRFSSTGGSPTELASDGANGYGAFVVGPTSIYLMVYGLSGDAIASVPIGGGTVTTLTSGSWSESGKYQGKLAVSGSNIYFVGSQGLESVAVTGGSPTILDSKVANTQIVDLAVDTQYVYFTGGSYAQQIPLSGGSPTTIPLSSSGGTAGRSTAGIAVDTQNVYWTGSSDGLHYDAFLAPVTPGLRVSTPLGNVASSYEYTPIVVDGSWLYFVGGKLPTAGGTGVVLGSPPGALSQCAQSIAVDSTSLYVATAQGVVKVPN